MGVSFPLRERMTIRVKSIRRAPPAIKGMARTELIRPDAAARQATKVIPNPPPKPHFKSCSIKPAPAQTSLFDRATRLS
jgi:hypothetical protein